MYFACHRVQLIDAVEQVIADIDIAVGMQQEVVHLGEAVADGPLGDLDRRQVIFPAARRRHGFRVLAQAPVFLPQQGRHLLVVVGGQAGAVGVHPLDHAQPLFLGAFIAHERRGLLVTEGAVELEGFFQVLVTAEVQLGQPHVGGITGDLLFRRHPLHHQLALDSGEGGVDVTLGAGAVVHRLCRSLEADLARRIGEAGDHLGAGIGYAVRGVAVVAEVRLGLGYRRLGHHDAGQGAALLVFYLQRCGAAQGSNKQQQGQASDKAHAGFLDWNYCSPIMPVSPAAVIGIDWQ